MMTPESWYAHVMEIRQRAKRLRQLEKLACHDCEEYRALVDRRLGEIMARLEGHDLPEPHPGPCCIREFLARR